MSFKILAEITEDHYFKFVNPSNPKTEFAVKVETVFQSTYAQSVIQTIVNNTIASNNELSEILANGNITGGNNIVITDGDVITGSGGAVSVSFGSDAYFAVVTPDFQFGMGDTWTNPANDYFWGTSTAVILDSSGTIGLTSVGNTFITSSTGNVAIESTAADVTIVSGDDFSVVATGDINIHDTPDTSGIGIVAGDMNIYSAAAITITAGNGFISTATTGDYGIQAIVGGVTISAEGTMDITTNSDDISIISGVNLSMSGAGVNVSATTGSLTLVSTIAANMQAPEWVVSNGAPAATLTDAFKMYSADIAAGNAVPHFENEAGDTIKLFKGAAVADAAGGVTIDAEARIAINALLARMRVTGGNGLIAD